MLPVQIVCISSSTPLGVRGRFVNMSFYYKHEKNFKRIFSSSIHTYILKDPITAFRIVKMHMLSFLPYSIYSMHPA